MAQKYYCNKHDKNHRGYIFCQSCTLLFSIERLEDKNSELRKMLGLDNSGIRK